MDIAEILFVAADPREFAGAMRYWQKVRPIALPVHWSREAIRKGKRVVAVANGAGPERARLAAAAVPYRKLCNIGFCGALDPSLKIGDVVVAQEGLPVKASVSHHLGRLASLEHVAQSQEEKRQLHAAGAMVVEMESAGLPVPFYCIKSVSDVAGEEFTIDFNAALQADGRFSMLSLLRSALRRPWAGFAELFRLQRHSRLASEQLGAFLDGCEF